MTETAPAWQASEREARAQAGELRAAAASMRERGAEAETEGFGSDHPGKPWCASWTYAAVRHVQRNVDLECADHPDSADCNTWGRYAGRHIAGMHPGVALALADWLDATAGILEHNGAVMGVQHALAVARAHLGTESGKED